MTLIRQTALLCALGTLTVAAVATDSENTVSPKPPCDSLMVDSTWHMVPPQWCGWKLDSTDIADPAQLVRLPDSLTFEDYRIYVTRSTREAFVRMAAAASNDGISLIADSGFRSPAFQKKIIRRRLADGQDPAKVLREVAPPGYSQHHTGRALDLVPSEARFAHTDTYRWLKNNAARFGFTESYANDTSTPFPWESWHWYYVGE
jgi:zinc D-Ala-D-Ala carboxypeptidase